MMEWFAIGFAVLIGTAIIYLLQPNARFFSRFNFDKESETYGQKKKREAEKKQIKNNDQEI
ncbi:MAG: hypothetical protein SFU91_12210 [Chloroherpetonaceae bacterium]|nr:hypothetical protein [Chloroherpetonaceae bacterium]